MAFTDPDIAVHAALVKKLTGDSLLIAMIGQRTYDDVPQDPIFPYVVINLELADGGDKTEEGADVTITFDVWSQYKGALEAKKILNRIYELMLLPLTVPGHSVPVVRRQFQTVTLDPDCVTRHGVAKYHAITSASST